MEEQCSNLELLLQRAVSGYLKYLGEWWDTKRWTDYLYKTREMDSFILPVVNTFLSKWDDDESYEESNIFVNCRTCLKILEEIEFAIAVCVNAPDRQRELWREGIKNTQDTIAKKLDYMSFMLLKDANKYLDPKSSNMEYGITDSEDEEDRTITLCLWVNLYMAVRRQGMSILGFSFKLPMDIVKKDCAVRLMHTIFDHVSPQKHVVEEVLVKEPEEVQVSDSVKSEEICHEENEKDVNEDHAEFVQEAELEGTDLKNDNEELEDEAEKNAPLVEDDEESLVDVEQLEKDDTIITEEETQLQVDEEPSSKDFGVFDPRQLPPLVEPELHIVDLDEYFVVGGVFHFHLYLVPKLNVRSAGITYIHREKPKLRRIIYKREIIPPRTLDGDTSYIASAYEKQRYRAELDGAIFLQLQLPKTVLFLHTPEPALLFVDKGGYSKDCVYEPTYDKNTRQISFKTNQFGIFAMLEKKYENFPYKKWSLKGGKSVFLTLVGKVLELEIEISVEGYAVTFLHPDDDFVLQKINSPCMVTDLLVEKLHSIGINIEHGYNAHEFVDICKKEKNLEDKVYDCISLLSGQYDFKSVKESTSQCDLIKLEVKDKREENFQTIVIKKEEVVDLETERKRIESEKAALDEEEHNQEDEILEGQKMEKDLEGETPKETSVKEITDETKDIGAPADETSKEAIFKDLYHYVMNELEETQKEEIVSTNVCLIENVRRLLRICRPLSSM